MLGHLRMAMPRNARGDEQELTRRAGTGDVRWDVLTAGPRRWSGLSRLERAERSRALAAAVRDGRDEDCVRAVLMAIDPAQSPLF